MKKIAFLVPVLVLLSTGVVVELVKPVMAEGTIYIRADGSIDPPTAPISSVDNVTYTLTGNIIEPTNLTENIIINVQRDNIVIDGAGHAIQGTTLNTTCLARAMYLAYRSNVTIKNLEIERCCMPVYLNHSSNNTIYGNKMANSCYGIYIFYSSNNTITGNNIKASKYHGIISIFSSNNIICYNNFINNTRQATLTGPLVNIWHHNYWSNYTGVDFYSGPYQNETGSDGIGDEAHTIDANNVDRYPLMGPFTKFYAGTWNGVTYYVDTVSNSTVSNFTFDKDQKLISFNVTGLNDTVGFCRVTIPNDLLGGPYDISVNDLPPLSLNEMSNGTHTFLYFTYNQSTEQVTVIGTTVVPEFSTGTLTLILLIILTVAIVTYARAIRSKKDIDSVAKSSRR